MVDPTVPNWAKVLMNCLSSLINERCSPEPRISKIEKDLLKLRDEHRLLRIQMAGLKDELDALEQYSRRNCLIFHGIPEEKSESTTKAVLDVIYKKVSLPPKLYWM